MELPPKAQPRVEEVLGLDKARASTFFERWRCQIIVAVAIAAALGLFLVWNSGGAQNAIQFVTEPASRGDLVVIVTATGTVEPTNKVDVSSELSGTIRSVLVDYNAKVTVGQSLAELDTDKLYGKRREFEGEVRRNKGPGQRGQSNVRRKAAGVCAQSGIIRKQSWLRT